MENRRAESLKTVKRVIYAMFTRINSFIAKLINNLSKINIFGTYLLLLIKSLR
jgi:hypothetical protein